MKQTNNAIKFLMAQYRAIFQNAYFKGLATAAVVTMGLAAGQAQAQRSGDEAFTGAEAIPSGETLIITGAKVNDADNNLNKYKFIQIGDNKSFEGDISIQGGDAANTGNYVSGSAPTTFTARSLTVSGGATNGLLIQGAENKAATATFTNGVNVQAGVISLTGAKANNGTGTLESTNIDIGSATVNTGAKIELAGTATQVGYSLAGDGADKQPVTGNSPKKTTDYTTLSLIKNGSLITKASADTTGAVVDAAVLDINGGAITVNKPSSSSDLTLNIVKGDLNAGTITTDAAGTLAIKFASGNFVDKDNKSVAKKLTLTSGTLTLGSDITLSGEGKLIVANQGAKLKATANDKGIKLTDNAAYAPATIADANAVAKNLPLTIGDGGLLELSQSLDLTQTENVPKFGAKANKADGIIGLAKGGIVKATDETLNADLGVDGAVAEADTITLKNPAQDKKVAFEQTVLSANKTLTLDSSDVTVKDSAEIVLGKESAKTIAASDAYKKDNADKKALLLGHAGSINSTNGTLTITSGGVMTVANGTWTSNADITLAADGGTAGALNVGIADADSAAKLSLGSKKLTTTEGTITVGGAKAKYAELDLTGANIEHTKTDVTIDKNGVLKLTGEQAQDLLTGSKSSNFKTFIKGGATLAVAGDLELKKADFANTNQLTADAINLSGDSSSSIATLKVDGSLTITDADDFQIKANNKLVAQGLVLNSGSQADPKAVG